jgi:hypothetical protein
MKPHRLRMTHNLLLAYGMYKKMEVYVISSIPQRHITSLHLIPIHPYDLLHHTQYRYRYHYHNLTY